MNGLQISHNQKHFDCEFCSQELVNFGSVPVYNIKRYAKTYNTVETNYKSQQHLWLDSEHAHYKWQNGNGLVKVDTNWGGLVTGIQWCVHQEGINIKLLMFGVRSKFHSTSLCLMEAAERNQILMFPDSDSQIWTWL